MARLGPERWELVRRLYEDSSLTVAEIAVFADVCESSIYQHIRRHGWVSARRPGVSPRKLKQRHVPATPALLAVSGAEEGGAPAPAEAGPHEIDRAEVARRLWAAVDMHLKEIEQFEAPQGAVRTAQSLSTLARTLETLIDVERDLAAALAPAEEEEEEDIDALVAELARRLEALP